MIEKKSVDTFSGTRPRAEFMSSAAIGGRSRSEGGRSAGRTTRRVARRNSRIAERDRRTKSVGRHRRRRRFDGRCALVTLAALALAAGTHADHPCSIFVRGDANRDAYVNISDAVFTLSYLFQAGRPPTCFDAADANDDGGLNISDPIYTLNALFVGGPPHSSPWPSCGPDPTDDDLGCEGEPVCPPCRDPASSHAVPQGAIVDPPDGATVAPRADITVVLDAEHPVPTARAELLVGSRVVAEMDPDSGELPIRITFRNVDLREYAGGAGLCISTRVIKAATPARLCRTSPADRDPRRRHAGRCRRSRSRLSVTKPRRRKEAGDRRDGHRLQTLERRLLGP